ncbi:ankyrin repeat domain-containing protein [Serratia nevei]|uniref:ankyrin repeat domain-containing protein n=1 Tax=Serratia nevei TaxID=2703794 RepID=UPI002549F2F7|nr:ankyrin repeat domain-containing protein [Serratia nevei]MDK5165518.1 ankyrin repeat domain-containing protein [Serratia nevei]
MTDEQFEKQELRLNSLFEQRHEDFHYGNWKLKNVWEESLERLRRMDDHELETVHPEAKSRMLIAAVNQGTAVDLDRLMETRLSPNPKAFHEGTAMHAAAATDDPQMLAFLISLGSRTNARDSVGRTPLHIAAFYGSMMFVREMEQSGNLDCTHEDAFGRTPLEHAIVGKNLPLVIKLAGLCKEQKRLQKGSRKERWTAMHEAAVSGNADAVRVLLDLGMDPDRGERIRGKTPLHYAIRNGHIDVVRLLLEAGADAAKKDKLGRSAMHEMGRCATRMSCEDEIECRVNLNFKRMLELLMKHGGTMTVRDMNGMTPLHYALAEFSEPEGVRAFIRPETINAANEIGNTPLHYAAAHVNNSEVNQRAICDMLLEAGADTEAVNEDGEKPMDFGNPIYAEALSVFEAKKLLAKSGTVTRRRSTL